MLTNCSNNYGPWQFPEKLIPVVILNAAAGEQIPLYGDSANVRDWLYVEDHVDALLLEAMGSAPTSRWWRRSAVRSMTCCPLVRPTPA